jgi:hypothetical protein
VDWPDLIPAVVVAGALMIVPGGVPLAVLGLRPLPLVALSPVVSIAVVAGSAAAASLLDVPWGPGPVAAAVLVAALLALALRLGVRRRLAGFAPEDSSAAGLRSSSAALVQYGVGLAAIGAAMATPIMQTFVSPLSISQKFDNAFHLNAISYAVRTGRAAPWDISVVSGGAIYPPGFHDQTALLQLLLPQLPLPAAVHAVMLTILLVAWPLSMALLIETLFRPGPAARMLTVPLSFSFTAFPLTLLDWGMIYPNVYGFALVPALLALVVELVRRQGTAQVPPVLVAPLLALAIVGAALAHPNAPFSAALLCLPAFVVGILRASPARGRERLWPAFLALSSVGVVAAWVVFAPSLATAEWFAVQTTSQATGEVLTGATAEKRAIWTGTVALLVGLAALLRTRRHLWLLVAWVIAAVVYVASTAWAEGPWRDLVSGMLYRDQFRTGALLSFVWVPVAVYGVQTVAELLGTQAHRLPGALRSRSALVGLVLSVVAALVVSGLTVSSRGFTERMTQVRGAYVLDERSEILSPSELEMFDSVEELVPPDATIVVDPWDGSSLAYAFTGRHVTTYYVTDLRSPQLAYAVNHIEKIAEDPDVCMSLDALGADHVLSFGDVEMFEGDENGRFEPLENLRGTEGLELLAQHGDAFLYEITACG